MLIQLLDSDDAFDNAALAPSPTPPPYPPLVGHWQMTVGSISVIVPSSTGAQLQPGGGQILIQIPPATFPTPNLFIVSCGYRVTGVLGSAPLFVQVRVVDNFGAPFFIDHTSSIIGGGVDTQVITVGGISIDPTLKLGLQVFVTRQDRNPLVYPNDTVSITFDPNVDPRFGLWWEPFRDSPITPGDKSGFCVNTVHDFSTDTNIGPNIGSGEDKVAVGPSRIYFSYSSGVATCLLPSFDTSAPFFSYPGATPPICIDSHDNLYLAVMDNSNKLFGPPIEDFHNHTVDDWVGSPLALAPYGFSTPAVIALNPAFSTVNELVSLFASTHGYPVQEGMAYELSASLSIGVSNPAGMNTIFQISILDQTDTVFASSSTLTLTAPSNLSGSLDLTGFIPPGVTKVGFQVSIVGLGRPGSGGANAQAAVGFPVLLLNNLVRIIKHPVSGPDTVVSSGVIPVFGPGFDFGEIGTLRLGLDGNFYALVNGASSLATAQVYKFPPSGVGAAIHALNAAAGEGYLGGCLGADKDGNVWVAVNTAFSDPDYQINSVVRRYDAATHTVADYPIAYVVDPTVDGSTEFNVMDVDADGNPVVLLIDFAPVSTPMVPYLSWALWIDKNTKKGYRIASTWNGGPNPPVIGTHGNVVDGPLGTSLISNVNDGAVMDAGHRFFYWIDDKPGDGQYNGELLRRLGPCGLSWMRQRQRNDVGGDPRRMTSSRQRSPRSTVNSSYW